MTRRLRPDELELWRQVARSAEPMHPHGPERRAAPKVPARDLAGPVRADRPDLKPFNIGALSGRGSPDRSGAPQTRDRPAPVKMDARNFGRMKRGKMRPEARLDLHGMTLAEAHPALVGFVLQSHAMGRRLVLVITGKGKRGDDDGPIPRRPGALRRQVPQWLQMAPARQAVLEVSEAHLRHGGGGAYYVYLRRSR